MIIVIIGGHFSPALSVIEKLKDKNEIFYFGRKTSFEGDKAFSFEYEQIKDLGIKFFSISTARMQRKFTRYTLLSFSKFPVGFIQSYQILRKIKPDLVLGFGGYLSIPVCIAAKILNIPIVIHEQTLQAGFANKFISKFADKILISWKSSEEFFPKNKVVFTGLPLTEQVLNAKKTESKKNELPTIYITGGSGGAHFINDLVYKNLEKIIKDFIVVHQTGNSQHFNDYELALSKKYSLRPDLSKRYIVKKFFNSMESSKKINEADFVIGRSGINTVSELIYFEKPAILIPLPFGQKNEQFKNAEFLNQLGLGEVLIQHNLTDKMFIDKIRQVEENLSSYKLKRKVLTDNAVENIINVLEDVSNKKKA